MNRRPGLLNNQKPANFGKTFKRLLQYLNKDKWIVMLAALFAVVSSLITVLTPVLAGKLLTSITDIWSQKSVDGVVDLFGIALTFNEVLILSIVTAALSTVLNLLQGYSLIGITQRLTYKMRSDLADKINTLPLNFFDKYKYGDVLSRVTNDVDTINQT